MTKLSWLLGVSLFSSSLFAVAPLTIEEAKEITVDAYIYGYPLVTMDMTREVMTNVAAPADKKAPMGQFYNSHEYPDATFHDVTAPNADTLYSLAWLDVSKDPYILSLPDFNDRFYMMPMLSGWTDVFTDPGTRTTGDKAATYAITGPNWKGTLPEGVKELKSPTSMVWILGRTYSTGTPEDYKKVWALQDQFKLVPLSSYGKEYTAPAGTYNPTINTKTPVRDQVNALSGEAFFNRLALLLKDNPPTDADAVIAAKMSKIGIVPGDKFIINPADVGVKEAVKQTPKLGLEKIMAQETEAGKVVNGWVITNGTGKYGTDYLQRAFVAFFGLGANLPDDAIYPVGKVDSKGEALSGKNKYTITFAKDALPPVKGFWSITMYNDQYFFVENSLKRYTVSPRNNLKTNEDGTTTLYIQNESPGKDLESNWLPAPKDGFILMMRLYWPEEAILSGSWNPPLIIKTVDDTPDEAASANTN